MRRSSHRAKRPVGIPARRYLAAARSRRCSRLVAGRAKICTSACCSAPSPESCPRISGTGSGFMLRSIENQSGPPSTSSEATIPARGPGVSWSGSTMVLAPGQAEATARSMRPGGIVSGTQSLKIVPLSLAAISHARCDCPMNSRLICPTRRSCSADHSKRAPCDWTLGGTPIRTSLAPRASRLRRARPIIPPTAPTTAKVTKRMDPKCSTIGNRRSTNVGRSRSSRAGSSSQSK